MQTTRQFIQRTIPQSFFPWIWGSLISILVFSCFLSWVSSKYRSFTGWLSFLGLMLGVSACVLLIWKRVQKDIKPALLPSWLPAVFLVAMIFRLGLGVFWVSALPAWGYADSQTHQTGYIMVDAMNRDTAAWELATSGKPLISAFRDYRMADQYGGLLYVSALVYRLFKIPTHAPLLVIVITSAFSSLAVLFGWGFSQLALGDKTARITAWFIAFFPEAVLLGSSQMREAFTITLAVIAFYGLVSIHRGHPKTGVLWLIAAVLLGIPLSPPFTGLLNLFLIIGSFAFGKKQTLRNWRFWILFSVLIALITSGIWYSLNRMPLYSSNPVQASIEWVKRVANYQLYQSEKNSGWVQKLFNVTPEWMHYPLILSYGVVQPFLPAALIAKGVWVARVTSIWRAVGWITLLPFLMYAPFYWMLNKSGFDIPSSLTVIAWLSILVSSFLGGGDQWDNPRYRSSFTGIQIALVSWIWVRQREKPDPWLRRILVGSFLVLIWFVPWYLRRYTDFSWPVVDVFKTVGLGIVSAALYSIWDWSRNS